MRIEDVVANHSGPKPPTLKARVFTYINDHPDEVFCYRDEDLARELGAKPSAIGFALWTLDEKGVLERATIDGKVYFGTHAALRKLRERLHPETKDDIWERVDAFRKKMFEKYGYIDLKDLLEETREGR